MSFTNQTQHYGLPQYIGTDVPAYLTDYNGAMATIDQGMNSAKTQADAAATAAGQAANDIAALNSTVQTQATQISAAAQSASSAQQTANVADQKADALDLRVANLEQGGSLKSVDVAKSQGSAQINIASQIPAGAKLVSAIWTGGTAGSTDIPMLAINVAADFIIFYEVSNTGSLTPFLTSGTVRLFYIE